MFLIDSIGLYPQSAMTLYIYRVGKTYPARNLVYRSKSIKNSNYSRIPPRLVRPVRPTGQTGRAPAGSAKTPDRSDRLVRPVDANFGCQHLQHGINARFPKRDQFSVRHHITSLLDVFHRPRGQNRRSRTEPSRHCRRSSFCSLYRISPKVLFGYT